jgi:hypothetical protein
MDMAPVNPFVLDCTDTIDSVYAAPSSTAGFDASHRGDVLRCAYDRAITAVQIDARLTDRSFDAAPTPSGVRIWRIAYRSEGTAGKELAGTALVLVPDKPIATPTPVVIFAHGTQGAATGCIESSYDILEKQGDDNLLADLYYAGNGYVVVAPDYNGYLGGTGPFIFSELEGHALLDATRVIRNLMAADKVADDNVLVGHSQGGHAVLSAQAEAASYGFAGKLSGVLAFAPVWYVAKAWGAALTSLAGFNTTSNADALWYSLLYFYNHGEILDGPGGGTAMYLPAKRSIAQTIFSTKCADSTASVQMLGSTTADFLDPAFTDSMSNCSILGTDCDKNAAATWQPRWRADRPAVDAHGPPIVIWQGGMDTTVSPGLAQCGFDKITADLQATPGATATLTTCADATADHALIVQRHHSWGLGYVGARTLGLSEPDACPGIATLGPPSCQQPPSNTD